MMPVEHDKNSEHQKTCMDLPVVDQEDRLYIGSADDHSNLEDNDIDFVLNLSFDCAADFGMDRSYAHLPFHDNDQALYRDFRQAADLLCDRYQLYDDEDLLVHCAAGVSRSVSISAACLAQVEDFGFDEALTRIQDRRGIGIDPHMKLQEYGRRFVENTDKKTEA